MYCTVCTVYSQYTGVHYNKESKLLTVETEVNGDSKSTNERGPSLVGCTRDFCSTLADLVGPVQNIYFLNVYWAGSPAWSPVS
jgi:hypothetical protein